MLVCFKGGCWAAGGVDIFPQFLKTWHTWHFYLFIYFFKAEEAFILGSSCRMTKLLLRLKGHRHFFVFVSCFPWRLLRGHSVAMAGNCKWDLMSLSNSNLLNTSKVNPGCLWNLSWQFHTRQSLKLSSSSSLPISSVCARWWATQGACGHPRWETTLLSAAPPIAHSRSGMQRQENVSTPSMGIPQQCAACTYMRKGMRAAPQGAS